MGRNDEIFNQLDDRARIFDTKLDYLKEQEATAIESVQQAQAAITSFRALMTEATKELMILARTEDNSDQMVELQECLSEQYIKIVELKSDLQSKYLIMNLATEELQSFYGEQSKVIIKKTISDCELTDTQLCQRIKANGHDDPQLAYGIFVIKRMLKPSINAKEFNQIFNSVSANAHITIDVIDFVATHVDTSLNKKCCITKSKYGFDIVWEFGMTGGEHNPLPERYQAINNVEEPEISKNV